MSAENDKDFKETLVTDVAKCGDESWRVSLDGWWLDLPKESGIRPRIGMIAKVFPADFVGRRVRGLFLDDKCAWYRTEEEEKQHFAELLYGKDATELLARWDRGDVVHSIEMGGLGPGYEQCIQITTFEMLRFLLEQKYPIEDLKDEQKWKRIREEIDEAVMSVPVVGKLGLSAAQWGAAISLSTAFYMTGPVKIMADEHVKDRKILVSKSFPG